MNSHDRAHAVAQVDDVKTLAGLLVKHAPNAFDRYLEALIARDEDAAIVAMMDGLAIVQERVLNDAERADLERVRRAFLTDAA